MKIHGVIYSEIIKPEVDRSKSGPAPDWERLSAAIEKKYGIYYANRVVTGARANWAADNKHWGEYTKHIVKYVDEFVAPVALESGGHWSAFELNNSAWSVFERSANAQELERALTWSGYAVLMDPIPNWMDTYANLLHKIGRSEMAIQWREYAVKLEPKNKSFAANLEKMKQGQPTWGAELAKP